MLTRVDVVHGDGSDTVVMSLPIVGATPKTSLLLRKISGLNPPDVSLFIGDFSRDGGIYQGRRVGNRNPVIILDLNPNPALGETIAAMRQAVAKAFLDPLTNADFVKLNLVDETGKVFYLVGYTEKIEYEVFDIETMMQISMICPDPYIRDNIASVQYDSTGWTTIPFTYTGTAETGFYVEIHINANTSVLTLENNGDKMVLQRNFFAGDIIRINTVRGQRSLSIVPTTGTAGSIAAYLTPTSPWLELHSQSNTMKVYGSTPLNLIASIRELRYVQAYWGM